MTKISDINTNIIQDVTGLYKKSSQEITDSFLTDLADQRSAGGYTDSGEMLKMASIPVVVCEQMLREGIDVYKAPIKDIIRWLKNNDMGHFLTTDKRI